MTKEKIAQRLSQIEDELKHIKDIFRKTMLYSQSDPEVVLTLARKAAESICKQIYINEDLQPGGKKHEKGNLPVEKMMLDSLILTLQRNNVLPKHIQAPLRTIQFYGNFGTHYQGKETEHITSDYVSPCLQALSTLVNWYFKNYLGTEEGIPPSNIDISVDLGHLNQIKDMSCRFSGVKTGITPLEDRGALTLNKVKLAIEAKEIDMLGWNLNKSWFSDIEFVEILSNRLDEKNVELRVLLPHPDSDFMRVLIKDRINMRKSELHGKMESKGIQARYENTVETIHAIQGVRQILKFVDKGMISCGIVRFDERMIVSIYSPISRGSSSMALLINNKRTSAPEQLFFYECKNIFNELWERAVI